MKILKFLGIVFLLSLCLRPSDIKTSAYNVRLRGEVAYFSEDENGEMVRIYEEFDEDFNTFSCNKTISSVLAKDAILRMKSNITKKFDRNFNPDDIEKIILDIDIYLRKESGEFCISFVSGDCNFIKFKNGKSRSDTIFSTHSLFEQPRHPGRR